MLEKKGISFAKRRGLCQESLNNTCICKDSVHIVFLGFQSYVGAFPRARKHEVSSEFCPFLGCYTLLHEEISRGQRNKWQVAHLIESCDTLEEPFSVIKQNYIFLKTDLLEQYKSQASLSPGEISPSLSRLLSLSSPLPIPCLQKGKVTLTFRKLEPT